MLSHKNSVKNLNLFILILNKKSLSRKKSSYKQVIVMNKEFIYKICLSFGMSVISSNASKDRKSMSFFFIIAILQKIAREKYK
jgi:hypothetical protein